MGRGAAWAMTGWLSSTLNITEPLLPGEPSARCWGHTVNQTLFQFPKGSVGKQTHTYDMKITNLLITPADPYWVLSVYFT